MLLVLLSALAIIHALPIPPEEGIQTENLNPQPLQICTSFCSDNIDLNCLVVFDLVNGEEDISEIHEDSSSTRYFSCTSGTSTPTESTSSGFASNVDVSELKVEDEESARGMRINIPGLDR
jgi:hypothetical protein